MHAIESMRLPLHAALVLLRLIKFMKHEKQKLKAAKAILELSSLFNDLNNFQKLPVILETILKKYIPIDWLGLYHSSPDSSLTVTTNPSLPFNWAELYQKIAPYDKLWVETFKKTPGTALLYSEYTNLHSEEDIFCFEYAKKYTDTVDILAMPTINTPHEQIIFGFYTTDQTKLFNQKDKIFIDQIGKLLISASNIMLLYKEFDFQKIAFDKLIKAQNCKYIILDNNFKTIEFPFKTMDFFQEIFNNKNLKDIPEQINTFILEELPHARLKNSFQEPTICKLNLKNGTLIIYTYKIEKYFLMKFIYQKYDILNEKTLPLTDMENKILFLLKQGFIVKEIADKLNLTERGVNFHKYNIVKKLRVSNITQAISVLADYGI